MGIMNKNAKTIIIPAMASVDGKIVPVTGIAAKVFSKMTNLNRLIIGSNVGSIGSKAFYNCKKLKKIDIYSNRLKNSTIGIDAFKNISAKAILTVSAQVRRSYKKIFQQKGLPKTALVR